MFRCSARTPAEQRDATMATALACIFAHTGSQAVARKCSTDWAPQRPTWSPRPSPAGDVRGRPR
eukprot:12539725-Alexandrium_andersonii.AAC.1